MLAIFQTIGDKIIPTSVFAVLTVLTIGTTIMGGTKVAGSLNNDKTNIQLPVSSVSGKSSDTETSENSKEVKGATSTNIPKSTTQTTKTTGTTTVAKKPSPTPTTGTGLAANTSNTASATAETGCIITLFGQQYDVTSLQSTHSGGDVFTCGTDMTAKYQSAHGTNVSRMQPYLVSSGSTGSTNSQPTGSSGSSRGSTGSTGSPPVGSTSNSANTWKPSGKCIVTLFGLQYDVTSLQSPTPAGTFACGTDMTSVYQNVHGTDVAMMKPYLVKNTNTGTTESSEVRYKNREKEDDDYHEDNDDD